MNDIKQAKKNLYTIAKKLSVGKVRINKERMAIKEIKEAIPNWKATWLN